MHFLLKVALSAALVGPVRSTSVEPDSGSVAFTIDTTWLRTAPTVPSRRLALLPQGAQVRVIGCREQACSVQYRRLEGYVARELLRAKPAASRAESDPPILSPEEKLALLMDEHRLSTQISIDADSDDSTLVPVRYQQR